LKPKRGWTLRKKSAEKRISATRTRTNARTRGRAKKILGEKSAREKRKKSG